MILDQIIEKNQLWSGIKLADCKRPVFSSVIINWNLQYHCLRIQSESISKWKALIAKASASHAFQWPIKGNPQQWTDSIQQSLVIEIFSVRHARLRWALVSGGCRSVTETRHSSQRSVWKIRKKSFNFDSRQLYRQNECYTNLTEHYTIDWLDE